MKKALLCLLLSLTLGLGELIAQPNILNPNDPMVELVDGTPPATPPANTLAKWVRRKMLDWNTDKFKSYYFNGMAFRLRWPNNYDPTKKYPVILFFHGGGEIDSVGNNELHLLHGAQMFEQMIDAGQFNAFMLFPQVSTQYFDDTYFFRINNVLDSMQKYCNSDPDRLISIGLSMGGLASIRYPGLFPQRAAVSISASPALIQTLSDDNKTNLTQIPIWVANGGLDVNPDPSVINNFVNEFTAKGSDIRHNFYPDGGHNVWYAQWAEPYLLPYWLNAHKANPLLYFQKSTFMTETGLSARIGITPGFAQYQWQKDNVDIAGASTNEITATKFGAYRVRFKRTSASDWSDWSPTPVVLSQDNIPPGAPTHLASSFTGNNFVNLKWDSATDNKGVTGYDVYINGVKKFTTTNNYITASSLAPNTSYKFTVKAFDNAGNNSAASNELSITTTNSENGLKYRYYEGTYTSLPNFNSLTPVKTGTTPNVDITIAQKPDYFGFVWEGYINITTPGQYTFETVSDDGSKLYFNTLYNPTATPLVNNDGLHAAISATGTINIPAVGVYPISITFFESNGGESMQVYWTGPGFSRQLIPNSAFSTGAPTSGPDVTPPSIPVNLKLVNTQSTTVSLDWDDATDNVGVSSYDVFVNGIKKYSTASSNIVADNLTPGTTYRFTVRSIDQAGNASDTSSGISTTTVSTSGGLKYRYYEGNFSQLPNFNTLTPVKTGTTPNVDISVKNINDYFAFVWEGNINITTPGTYTFETISDDGSKFYFNNLYSPTATALVNNDYFHGPTSVSATVNIPAAGSYPIAITFFENTGGESMQVYWSGPGITRQLIPNSAFTLPEADITPPSIPANLKVVNSFTNSLSLDWDDATDNVGVSSYDIYINGTKKYSSTVSNIIADSLTPSTVYTIKVKAIDQAGNASAFSTEISASTTSLASGLKYRYYEGSYTSVPNFTSLTPVKTGTSPNVDISVRNINDYFAFLWEGNIRITTPGTYTFETVSDDGSKLYFNTLYTPSAVALVNNDGPHGPTSVSQTINIPSAGSYPIAIAFFEITGGEQMQVYWSGPGFTRQLIPNSVLSLPASDVTPPSAPGNFKAVYTGRNFVYLDWDPSTDDIGVARYDIYVNGTKKYSTTTETTLTDSTLAAGTTYSYMIKAVDVAGNESTASTISAATEAKANGLKYRFYQGNFDAMPNFNNLTPVKTGSSANVDLTVRTAGVNDYFAFVWEGYINIQTPGNYTFETNSDDGSKLYFNSLYSPTATPLINNDYLHGPTTVSKTVFVPAAGLYPICMTFFENTGGEQMLVYMSGPGIPRQQIPNVAFIENSSQGNSINRMSSSAIGNETIESTLANSSRHLTKAYPNPVSNWLNIDFFNESSKNDVRVNIYDMNGKLVANQYFGNLPAGNNTLKMNVAGSKLLPGAYFVKLDINGLPSKVIKLLKENK